MKIGILSAGGDCPGINAAIRGVGKTALLHYGMEVVGIHNGFSGLLHLLMGSVAEGVLRQSPLPVLLFRRPDDET